jgi:hypothetical protein
VDARLTTLLCKEIIVPISKEVKIESNLAEYSKERYDSKSAAFPMIMMIVNQWVYYCAVGLI